MAGIAKYGSYILQAMKAVAYIDGSSLQNPGYAAIAVRIYDESGQLLLSLCEPYGKQTNNYAEYLAYVRCLEEARQLGVTELCIFTDSELIAKQWSGEYQIRSGNLKPLYEYTLELRQQMEVEVRRIPTQGDERLKLTNRMAQEAAKFVQQQFATHYLHEVDDE